MNQERKKQLRIAAIVLLVGGVILSLGCLLLKPATEESAITTGLGFALIALWTLHLGVERDPYTQAIFGLLSSAVAGMFFGSLSDIYIGVQACIFNLVAVVFVLAQQIPKPKA